MDGHKLAAPCTEITEPQFPHIKGLDSENVSRCRIVLKNGRDFVQYGQVFMLHTSEL